MTPQTTDIHVNPSDETIHIGPLGVRFLVTGDDASGSVALFELTVPAAQRLAGPAHSHDHYEETIYGIEGVLTWTVGDKPIEVGPGQALCIPRGAVHRFDNHGTEDVKALSRASWNSETFYLKRGWQFTGPRPSDGARRNGKATSATRASVITSGV